MPNGQRHMPNGQKCPERPPETPFGICPAYAKRGLSGPLLPIGAYAGHFSLDLQNLLSPEPELNLGKLTSSTKNGHMPGICQKRGRNGSKVDQNWHMPAIFAGNWHMPGIFVGEVAYLWHMPKSKPRKPPKLPLLAVFLGICPITPKDADLFGPFRAYAWHSGFTATVAGICLGICP